ncbi:hypothetical protein JCM18237_28760 [Halorubrum luteum]
MLTHQDAVERLNSGGCGRVVGFIPAVNGEAFSLTFRNFAYVSIIIVVEDDADPGEFSGTLEIRAEGAVSQV